VKTTAPVHLVGRFYGADKSGRMFTYPGTQIRTRFTGTGLTVKLTDSSGQNQFSVVVDGRAPVVLKTNPTQQQYTVARGLTPGDHELTITRRTETWLGATKFSGFFLDDGAELVETPEPFSRVIEVVGDSISCGFGVLGANGACAFSPETEDATVTYGALTAAAVNAAMVDVCWSGRGMLRNNDGSTNDTMPLLYDRNWDAPRYVADVVVVNLGTNDYFAGGDPGPAFETTYVAFVKKVRATHPKAQIICGIGTMLTGADAASARAHVQAVVKTLNQAGDTKVAFVDWAEQSPADGVGCANHPNQTTQKKMADVLTAKVKELTSW
jgi:lysophospholipase L1-like esterase